MVHVHHLHLQTDTGDGPVLCHTSMSPHAHHSVSMWFLRHNRSAPQTDCRPLARTGLVLARRVQVTAAMSGGSESASLIAATVVRSEERSEMASKGGRAEEAVISRVINLSA